MEYRTPPECPLKNPLFCTVMRGDIGLYENFEKINKVQEKYLQSTIKVEHWSYCLVAWTSQSQFPGKGSVVVIEENVALRQRIGETNV